MTRTVGLCSRAMVLVLLLGSSTHQDEVDGAWVAKQIEQRDIGRDARFEMEMRLFDHRGRVTKREMTLLTRRQGGLDWLLIRFDYPGDIRDTGFLAIETEDGKNERFLYLPALGRSRRISAQERQDSFVGSDLTYEDLSGRRFEDYRYHLQGEEKLSGHGPSPIAQMPTWHQDLDVWNTLPLCDRTLIVN